MRRLVVPLILGFGCGGAPPAVKPPVTPAPIETPIPAPAAPAPTTWMPARYPQSRVQDVKEDHFGVTVHDPYRWLEDPKQQEVQAWMQAQDDLARQTLAKLPARAALAARYSQLFRIAFTGPPVHRGARTFYDRSEPDQNKPIHLWKGDQDGVEHVLLDENSLSPDGLLSVGDVTPNWPGTKVAFTTHENNSDAGEIRVRDVASGKDSDSVKVALGGGASWNARGDGFYYPYLPPAGEKLPVSERMGALEVRFHRLGTKPAEDTLAHAATGDPLYGSAMWDSQDGHWQFFEVAAGTGDTETKLWFRDLRRKNQPLQVLYPGPAIASVIEYQDKLYLTTNDGAANQHIFVIDPRSPERGRWKEIVAERADFAISDVQIVGGHLLVSALHNAASTLELRDLDGRLTRQIELPGVGEAEASGRFDEDTVYVTFMSFMVPQRVYQLSIATGQMSLLEQKQVPFDPEAFTTEQVTFPSKDGTPVSMFLVHRKDAPRDGSMPFLIYGYGGFSIPMTPSFSARRVPWLEAGGGYALVNLRGGNEYGESWHVAGMLEHKQNVFDDMISASEWLIKNRWTRADRLVAQGESNGGLLMGALMTQRPDLYRAINCGVPLLDMVRYDLFGLGKAWIAEYGNVTDKQAFTTLYGYSPYHHVTVGTRYPAILFDSADSDDRVDPLHARKMAAFVQAASTSGLPVLLRIERNSGHVGAARKDREIEHQADITAFFMDAVGMTYPPVADAGRTATPRDAK